MYPNGGGPHPDHVQGQAIFQAAQQAAAKSDTEQTTEEISLISKITVAVHWKDEWVARYGCKLDEDKYNQTLAQRLAISWSQIFTKTLFIVGP